MGQPHFRKPSHAIRITTNSNDSNEVSNNDSCKTNMIVRVTLVIIVTPPIYA
jgi:hypothetical protein